VTSSWFFLSTLNYDARSTTHQINQLTISALSCTTKTAAWLRHGVTCWNCFGIHFWCSLQGQHVCTCAIMFPTAQTTSNSRTDKTCHLRHLKCDTIKGSPTDRYLNIGNPSTDVTSFLIKHFSHLWSAVNTPSLSHAITDSAYTPAWQGMQVTLQCCRIFKRSGFTPYRLVSSYVSNDGTAFFFRVMTCLLPLYYSQFKNNPTPTR